MACSDEREVLMFLGQGATRFALNPTKAEADPVELEDIRCSLIGNTFHAGVFALVLSAVMEKHGLRDAKPTAQEIVDRQGLYPGERYVPGLTCHLGRPPGYHRLDQQRRGHCYTSFDEARGARSDQSNTTLESVLWSVTK